MSKPSSRLPSLAPLAACFALAFGIDHTAGAVTLLVTDCGDGAPSGTLRHTVNAAGNGDTVQIPAACSTITLLTGAIFVANNIVIDGPGSSALTIDAGSTATPQTYNRAFIHAGTGTLSLDGMTLAHAKYTGGGFPLGGCIYSDGNVAMTDMVLSGCEILPPSNGTADSKGGAIYAKGNVIMANSTISGSLLLSANSHTGLGGAIYTLKGGTIKYSDISNNVAFQGSGGEGSRGGGIFAAGTANLTVYASEISGNVANINAAIQVATGGTSSTSFTTRLRNSTISGNKANGIQAIGSYLPVEAYGATIAFNRANSTSSAAPVGLYSNQQITMQSSIFANNTAIAVPGENDIYSRLAVNPLTGAGNLIVATSNSAVPLGTLSSCPKLGHLSPNGGPTQTIPLLAGSPAINTGNNAGAFATDQRQTGFVRVVGAAADIGAYERQAAVIDDVIFFSQFEGICD